MTREVRQDSEVERAPGGRSGVKVRARAGAAPPAGNRPRGRQQARDEARVRARSPRRFQASGGSEPPVEEEGPIWPPPRRPRGPAERHLEWPYWILLVLPWVLLGSAWLLDQLNVCLICIPSGLQVP